MRVVKQRILGLLNRGEMLNQAQGLTAMPTPEMKKKFWTDYGAAQEFRSKLAPMPATPVALAPLSETGEAYVRDLEGTDSFQESFGGKRYGFARVPLDRLSPLQTFTNVTPKLTPPDPRDERALLEYCLPLDARIKSEVMITGQGARFTTDRYGMTVAHVKRRIREGQLVLSFEHPNLLQIVRAGNTLVIFNGTHRCLELLAAGFKEAPAIVLSHPDPNEIEWPSNPGMWKREFIFAQPRPPQFGPRPPLLSDFLTPLAVEAQVVLLPSVVDVAIGASSPVAMPQQVPMQMPMQLIQAG